MSDDVRDWDIVQSAEVGDYEVFRVRRVTARMPDTQKTFDFHVIERQHGVQAIPLLPDGRVLMIEQFRHGVQHVSLEFPAGLVNEGEAPADGALRELEEATGYRAGRHEVIGVVEPDTALLAMRVTIVAAYDCTPTGQRNLDEAEQVRTRLLTVAEVDDLIARGKITLAVSIAAWHLFLSRAKLPAR